MKYTISNEEASRAILAEPARLNGVKEEDIERVQSSFIGVDIPDPNDPSKQLTYLSVHITIIFKSNEAMERWRKNRQ